MCLAKKTKKEQLTRTWKVRLSHSRWSLLDSTRYVVFQGDFLGGSCLLSSFLFSHEMNLDASS